MVTHKLANDMAYPPRAMRSDRAAAYLDLSEAAFLRLVEEGLMPPPVRIKGAVTWDRLQLDAAYENFKTGEQSNSIHKLLGIKP
jgi:predicted DNA-binding transcriptional regulator AlpA